MKLLKKILHFLTSPLCEYFAPPLPEGPVGEVRLSPDGFTTVELPQGLSITAQRVNLGYSKEDSEAAALLVEALKRGLEPPARFSVGEQPSEEDIYPPIGKGSFEDCFNDGFREGSVNFAFIKECIKALRNTKVAKFKPLNQDFTQFSSAFGFAKGSKIESLSGLGVIARLLDKRNLITLHFPDKKLSGFVTTKLIRVDDNHDQGITTSNMLDVMIGLEDSLTNLEVKTAKGLYKSFVKADKTYTFKQLADGLERRYLK